MKLFKEYSNFFGSHVPISSRHAATSRFSLNDQPGPFAARTDLPS